MAARPGHCYLVGAGPGDPQLVTLRAAELIATADLLLHDELVAAPILARASGEVRFVGKRGTASADKDARQAHIIAEMIAAARAGQSVVRLKGGDPLLFGRGAEEALMLKQAGVPFEIVPGVASPLGLAAYAGIPLTHRDLASGAAFVTAVRKDGSDFDWRELSGFRGTVCVFMGSRIIDRVCRGLIELAGRPPTTPAAAVEWASSPRQRVVCATLADLPQKAAEARIGSPALIAAGQVVALRESLSWFESQPLFGKRVLVTRAAHQAAATESMLRARGAEPLAFPVIAIAKPDDPEPLRRAVAALALGRYRLVAFTSDNGVRRFFEAIQDAGRDARIFGGCSVAAIGPATAAALESHGIVADIIAERYVAESLAEAIVARADKGRVLLPRAAIAREALPELLAAAGLPCDVVPAYRTVLASPDRAAELRALVPSLDAVLLTSASTAQNLCALLGPDAPSLLSGTAIASIGAITTAAAEQLGLRIAVTASVSTTAGLADALEGYFARQTGA